MEQQAEKPLQQDYKVEAVLYILRIAIGSTSFYKYGVAEDINRRLVKMKSNIKSFAGYETRAVNIDVLYHEATNKAKEIEKEIKEKLKKKRIKKSGFYFAGHTETVEQEDFDIFKKIVKQTIENYR